MGFVTTSICNYMFARPKARKPGADHKKPGLLSRKLMGPNFEVYRDARTRSAAQLAALPYTPLEITAKDGLILRGRLIFPSMPVLKSSVQQAPVPRTAFLVHGLASTGIQGFASIALKYLENGWNVFLPDLRAAGESDGDFHTFGITECEDLLLWLTHLNLVLPEQEIILHGKSLGASTLCMLSCCELPVNVKAIVSDCAFARQDEELLYMFRTIAGIRGFPAKLLLSRVEKWYSSKFGFPFTFRTPIDSVTKAKVPMFFVHGASDRYVPPEDASRLFAVCPMPKELLLIPNSGHTSACFWGKDTYFEAIFRFLDHFAE